MIRSIQLESPSAPRRDAHGRAEAASSRASRSWLARTGTRALGRRHGAIALLLALAAGVAACDDDTTGPEVVHPAAVTMRVATADQVVDVDLDSGQLTNAPLVIPVGVTPVTISFLLENGDPDPVITEEDFDLNVEVADETIVTFTATGAFTGNLTGLQAGEATTLSLELVHGVHQEFTFPVPVRVE